MRMSCESDGFLLIERREVSNDDVPIGVTVRCRGFTGRIETWILRTAWVEFCERLRLLEERRQGEASVESMSPKEFQLTVRSTDQTGHMAIEGLLGYRGVHGETLLSFSPMAFDPSSLLCSWEQHGRSLANMPLLARGSAHESRR